jgi:bifunctional non-homologous end joining protein LigD
MHAIVAGVPISHPDRVVYPALGVTKAELAQFYETIGSVMVPHVRGRPLTLVRCPTGLPRSGAVRPSPCIFVRHAKAWGPPVLRRIKIREKTKIGEYLVADDVPGIVGLIQMGVLEIHTQNVTDADLERPDRIVFDLDPGEGVSWPVVASAARELHDRLEEVGLESWVKTTGGKGLHVLVPVAPDHGWDAIIAFSRAVAEALVRDAPERFTARMAKSERPGKIFIDWLRNNRANTSVAAYSTRAKPNAPLSLPITWEELDLGHVRPDGFTLENARDRVTRTRAAWADYFRTRQRLSARTLRRVGLSA